MKSCFNIIEFWVSGAYKAQECKAGSVLELHFIKLCGKHLDIQVSSNSVFSIMWLKATNAVTTETFTTDLLDFVLLEPLQS